MLFYMASLQPFSLGQEEVITIAAGAVFLLKELALSRFILQVAGASWLSLQPNLGLCIRL